MRALTTLLLYAVCHAPVSHAMAIPMDDEPWVSEDIPARAEAPKPRASRNETPAKVAPPTKKATSRAAPAAPALPQATKKSPTPPVAKAEPAYKPAPRASAPAPAAPPVPRVAQKRAEAAAVPAPVPAPVAKINPAPVAKPKTPPEVPKVAEKKLPPPAMEKPKVTCSGRTNEIKELNAQSINTNIFNLTWAEDTPVVGGSARFKVIDHGGDAQIEMINSSGESVGVSPAKMCLITLPSGKKALRVSLQMAKLNLGFLAGAKIRGALMTKFGSADELPIIVSASSQQGKVHIADGVNKSMIDSDFTPVGARQ